MSANLRPPPDRVGVVGGGRMGSGIAHAFLVAGSRVVLVEVDAGAADAAHTRIETAVRATAARGKLDRTVDDVVAGLNVEHRIDAVADASLVIESVPERADLKANVLGAIEAVVRPDCVLASNTSSLSIDELATSLERPELFLGLHFFNPVPASKLIEVVTGGRTATSVTAAATAWVAWLGKSFVVVRSSPGFASSRLGVALGLEAIRMVEEGVASPEDIDTAMTLGYSHPIGPLRLTDLVGLDVRLGVAEYLARTLGQRFEAPDLLRRKVEAGELGRKSGRGFYEWPKEKGEDGR